MGFNFGLKTLKFMFLHLAGHKCLKWNIGFLWRCAYFVLHVLLSIIFTPVFTDANPDSCVLKTDCFNISERCPCIYELAEQVDRFYFCHRMYSWELQNKRLNVFLFLKVVSFYRFVTAQLYVVTETCEKARNLKCFSIMNLEPNILLAVNLISS